MHENMDSQYLYMNETAETPADNRIEVSKRLLEHRELFHRYAPFELGPERLFWMLSRKRKAGQRETQTM